MKLNHEEVDENGGKSIELDENDISIKCRQDYYWRLDGNLAEVLAWLEISACVFHCG